MRRVSGGPVVPDIRAVWQANTVFSPGDVFTYLGGVYEVTATYTSGASFGATDLANTTLWEAQSGTYAGAAYQGSALKRVGRVLTCGSAGAFDAALVESMSPFWDPSRNMWGGVYVGYTQASGNNGGTGAAVEASIGLVWFTNGLSNPPTKWGQILAKSANSYDVAGCTAPFVWIEGGVVYLFYAGLTASGYEGGTPTLCLVTASDIQTAPAGWTRSGLNPVVAASAAGTGWRSSKVYHPQLVKRASTYYLFVNAFNGTVEQIGYGAGSAPAGPFTMDDTNSPILPTGTSPVWDSKNVGDPFVRQLADGSWAMDFYGSDGGTFAADSLALTSDAAFPLGWAKFGYPTLQPGLPGTFDSKYAHKPGIAVDPQTKTVYHFYTGDDGTARSVGLAVDTGLDPTVRHIETRVVRTSTTGNPWWLYAKSAATVNASGVIGDDIGPSTGVSRTKLVMGNTSGITELLMGQDATHNVVVNWTYNATAANAKAAISTWANGNELDLDASVLKLQSVSGKDVTLGKSAPATTATAGFPYIPAGAGAPTGVPTGQAGFVPFCYDTTNHKLWFYDSGWKGVVVA